MLTNLMTTGLDISLHDQLLKVRLEMVKPSNTHHSRPTHLRL
jgi:hypothetical protein